MMTDDRFDRAVRRERQFRERRMLRTRRDVTRFMTVMHATFLGVWAVVLAAHAWIAGTGGGVFQVHAVIYALAFAAAIAMQIVFRIVGRWGWFGDGEAEDLL